MNYGRHRQENWGLYNQLFIHFPFPTIKDDSSTVKTLNCLTLLFKNALLSGDIKSRLYEHDSKPQFITSLSFMMNLKNTKARTNQTYRKDSLHISDANTHLKCIYKSFYNRKSICP